MRRASSVMIAAVAVAGIVGTSVHYGHAETTTQPSKQQVIEQTLDDLARIASVLVDGELCLQIVTDRAEGLLFKEDPRDPYASSDNYDVNLAPFVQTKKLLGRIALLADFPVDCNLVLKCKNKPEQVQMVIRQYHGWTQCYLWGARAYEPTPEMKRVMEKGERVLLRSKNSDHVFVLAPVRDSLGDVVGLVEVCTRTEQWGRRRQ